MDQTSEVLLVTKLKVQSNRDSWIETWHLKFVST